MPRKKINEIILGTVVVEGGKVEDISGQIGETFCEFFGVEDGEYSLTAEEVDGVVKRVVIDFDDPLLDLLEDDEDEAEAAAAD